VALSARRIRCDDGDLSERLGSSKPGTRARTHQEAVVVVHKQAASGLRSDPENRQKRASRSVPRVPVRT
jgi:hypothetical protein